MATPIPVKAGRAWMSTSATSTGSPITLGSALSGYRSFADAGVGDGQTVRYVIVDGANWEIGTGVYTASGTTLTRVVSSSSNSDAAINLSGSATVFVDLPAEDFVTEMIVPIIVFDSETSVEVGDDAGKVFFRVPQSLNGWDLVRVAGCHHTAGTGAGSDTTDIQVRNKTQAADMLSTKLTIDEDETDTATAAAAAVIDTANDDVATGDVLVLDVDDVVTGTAPLGLQVELTFHRP